MQIHREIDDYTRGWNWMAHRVFRQTDMLQLQPHFKSCFNPFNQQKQTWKLIITRIYFRDSQENWSSTTINHLQPNIPLVNTLSLSHWRGRAIFHPHGRVYASWCQFHGGYLTTTTVSIADWKTNRESSSFSDFSKGSNCGCRRTSILGAVPRRTGSDFPKVAGLCWSPNLWMLKSK